MEEQPRPNEAADDDRVNGILAQMALEFHISPPSSLSYPISSSPKRSEKALSPPVPCASK